MPKQQANAVDAHVGQKVRQRRVALGMSQERLGHLLGLTFQQVQKYERGANRIGASRLFELSAILEVPVGYFFADMGSDAPSPTGNGRQNHAPAQRASEQIHEVNKFEIAFSRIRNKSTRQKVIDLVIRLGDDEAAEIGRL